MTYTGEKICSKNNCRSFKNCIFSTISDINTAMSPKYIIRSKHFCHSYKMEEEKMDDVIRTKVVEFIKQQKKFTSVDVSNVIKRDGHWVGNTDVTKWLKANFSNLNSELNADFCQTSISVAKGCYATLYMPYMDDARDYTDRNQKALSPDDFKAIHGYSPFQQPPVNPTTLTVVKVTATVTKVPKVGERIITEFKNGRVRIPAVLVKKIGLDPYMTVRPSKLDIDVNEFPKNLRVHADGRISIPRKCIKVDNATVKLAALKAFVNSKKICFELA